MTTNINKIFFGIENIQLLKLTNLKADYIDDFSYMFKDLVNLRFLDLSNFRGSSTNNSMEGMFYNCNNIISLDLSNLDFSYTYNINYIFKDCKNLKSINLSNFITSLVCNFSFLFHDCINLENIDLSNFKGSSITNRMDYMFDNCKSLLSIHLKKLDLSNTTNIEYMFNGCTSLKEVVIFNLNISFVKNYSYMFNNCISLEFIHLFNFNNKVNNTMEYMFNNCNKLTSLILSKFDISLTSNMKYMFNNCSSITYLNLSELYFSNINLSMENIFHGCINLKSLDFQNIDISHVFDSDKIFKSCSNFEYLNLSNMKALYKFDLSYIFSDLVNLISIDLSNFEGSLINNTMKGLFNNCNKLESLDLSKLDFSHTYDIKDIFKGCFSIKYLNLSKFFYSDIETFSFMFNDCKSLEILDLSNFKGSSRKNRMDYMFNGLHSLKSLTLLNLDLSKTTNISYMFNNCHSITKIKIKNLYESTVLDYSYMFNNCNSLQYIEISNIQVSKEVNTMEFMFNNCYDLTSVNISTFDTTLTKNMSFLFNNCISLPYLNLSFIEGIKINNTLDYMFIGCNNLISIDFPYLDISYTTYPIKIFYECNNLKYLNLSNLKADFTQDFSYMFNNLKNLISIDLSHFKGSLKKNNMKYMFNNCFSLLKLDLSTVNFEQTINFEYMFNNCSSLQYLNLSSLKTTYSQSYSHMFSNCINLEILDISSFKGSLSENTMDFMFSNCKKIPYFYFPDLYLSYTNNTSYMFNGCASLTSIVIINLKETSVSDYSYMFNDCISLKYANFSNFKTDSKFQNKMEYMFNKCNSLTSIDFNHFNISSTFDQNKIFQGTENIQYLNLSNLGAKYKSDISYLFHDLTNLISIDLSHFERPLIENNLEGLFINCINLKYVDLSTFDFSLTINIKHIFKGCYSLYSLNLTSFYNSRIPDFSYLFNDCYNLTILDLKNFQSSKVSNRMEYMFGNCRSLEKINLTYLQLYETTNVSGMFSGCSSLKDIYLFNDVHSKIRDFSYMFNSCYSLSSINLRTFIGTDETHIMDYMFNNCSKLQKVIFSYYEGLDTRKTISMKYMFNNCTSIPSSKNLDIFIFEVTELSYMFNNCISLTSFSLNDNFIKPSEKENVINNYDYMFSNCIRLTRIEISNLGIHSKVNLKGFFNNCISLKSVIFSEFNFTKAIDLSFMFMNCIALESLNLSAFTNFETFHSMEGMFQDCETLYSLDLSKFDSSKAISMKDMFNGCSRLTTINFTHFNTSNVVDMNGMFANCKSLTSLNLGGFVTNLVTDMSNMFENCNLIIELSLLSFNTSLVKRMDSMFKNCISLIFLYIPNFNTSSVVSMGSTFENCISLKLLNLQFFDTTSVTDMSWMFSNCNSMEYLNIRYFSENNLEKFNNIFDFTAENLVFCKEGNDDSNLLEILNEKICPINTCDINWKNEQKVLNEGEDSCSDDCINNKILKYRASNKCYSKCPNNTFLANGKEYICEILCPEEKPYFSNFYFMCVDTCFTIDFFNGNCKINTNLFHIYENFESSIDDDIINDYEFYQFVNDKYNNNENILLESNYQTYYIGTFKNNPQTDFIINFNETEKELKSLYNLNEDDRLVFFLVEIKKEGIKLPILEYNIYNLDTKRKLDLSFASNIKFNISYPFLIEKGQEYKYDPFDPYYSDPCISYNSINGLNIIINDRIDEFFKNQYSLCEKNCKYKGYNSELGIVTCECSIKETLRNISQVMNDEDLLFSDLKLFNRVTNFYVFTCFKLLHNKNFILTNVGNFVIIFLFIVFIITFFLFIKSGFDKIIAIIRNISASNFYFLEKEDKKNIKTKNASRKNFDSDVHFSIDNLKNMGIISFKNFDIRIKKIMEPTNYEMNLFSYDTAKKKDNRKMLEYYFNLVKRKNFVLFAFVNVIDYNLKLIKIYLFIFSIVLFLVINTLFFTDSTIHYLYIKNGNINFLENYLKILGSVIISKIIIYGMKYLVLTEPEITQIKQITKKGAINKLYEKTIRKIFRKYVIFAVINVCFIFFSWAYLSCFFAVYKKDQIYLIINTSISFIFDLIFPFAFCFIPTILRFISLKERTDSKEWLYKLSQFLQL